MIKTYEYNHGVFGKCDKILSSTNRSYIKPLCYYRKRYV
jgi:hypothetical protein